MIEATICPKELVSPNPVSPHNLHELERLLIFPLVRFIESCDELGVKIVFSNDLLCLIQEEAPWQECNDPEVRTFLETWISGVISPLLKLENINTNGNVPDPLCGLLGNNIGAHFKELLQSKQSDLPTTILGKWHFGVFVKNGCAECVECTSCINIDSGDDVFKIKYPWYLIYPVDLPWQGDVPFRPPANWEFLNTPKRHTDHGYLDENGRSWGKDKFHGNHWDVQLGGGAGDYLNVGYKGNLLD
jgi:hypothetical protein